MLNYRFIYFIKRASVYVFAVLVLIVFTLEGSIPVFPFGAIITLVVTAVSGLIAGLLHGHDWLNPQLLRKCRIALFVGLAVIVPSYLIYRVQIKENFKNASQVVKSLRAYHKQNGDYPVSLNVLVPDYIAEVPVVYLGVWPRSFEYEYIKPVSIRNDDAKLQNLKPAFYIEYNGYLGVKYTFLSHEKSWKLDD